MRMTADAPDERIAVAATVGHIEVGTPASPLTTPLP